MEAFYTFVASKQTNFSSNKIGLKKIVLKYEKLGELQTNYKCNHNKYPTFKSFGLAIVAIDQ
jgi:hypothetical protein